MFSQAIQYYMNSLLHLYKEIGQILYHTHKKKEDYFYKFIK